MADTLTRLAGPTQLTASPVTVYSTPMSTTATVRDIIVCNTTGTAATFYLSLGADAAATRLFSAVPIEGNSTTQVSCGTILESGEVLQSYSGTNAALTLTISGVETA